MADKDLVEMFRKKAEAVQCEVVVKNTLLEAIKGVAELLKERGITSAVVSGFDKKTLDLLKEILEGNEIECFCGAVRNHLPSFTVGITPGHAGISDTGTVVILSTSEDVRLTSMVADHHLVVMPTSFLYRELLQIEEFLQEQLKDSPTYISFITGPSRTADIERVLTIGVHGPKEVTIILYEE